MSADYPENKTSRNRLPAPTAATKNRMIRFSAPWLAVALVLGLSACAAAPTRNRHPDVGAALKTGLNRQVITPQAPVDRTPAEGLPGDLAAQVYQKRYVKTMTAKDNQGEDGKASREFQ